MNVDSTQFPLVEQRLIYFMFLCSVSTAKNCGKTIKDTFFTLKESSLKSGKTLYQKTTYGLTLAAEILGLRVIFLGPVLLEVWVPALLFPFPSILGACA